MTPARGRTCCRYGLLSPLVLSLWLTIGAATVANTSRGVLILLDEAKSGAQSGAVSGGGLLCSMEVYGTVQTAAACHAVRAQLSAPQAPPNWRQQHHRFKFPDKSKASVAMHESADDAGLELGAYGEKICQTPNIDQLARRSVRFIDAFTSVSSCSPSRAALLTGAPSHATGMYGLHHGVHHFNAFDTVAVTSLPHQLKQRGVYTGIIGKKHVGPSPVFAFDYEQTEEHHPINQVGRNITLIKLLAREFLARAKGRPFMLLVGFHDPHRCRQQAASLGAFCERFGSGEPGTGRIADWHPWYYQWDEITPPPNVPDTEPARRDLAAQYTAISRLDQGVGLVLKELAAAGRDQDTLVVYTSDNGPPFPAGRTNLYELGVRVPLLISAPNATRSGHVSAAMVSQLDVPVTARDWLGLPHEVEDNNDVLYEDAPKTLLPILNKEPPASDRDAVLMSHTHHEVTMYYPMRALRTRRYKLIHNINYGMPFPIDQDLFVSDTFQDIVNRTRSGTPLPWYTSLARYRQRPEWQLFDLHNDPLERRNLHGLPQTKTIEASLQHRLLSWQTRTNDPWQCAPHGVMVGHACQSLDVTAPSDH